MSQNSIWETHREPHLRIVNLETASYPNSKTRKRATKKSEQKLKIENLKTILLLSSKMKKWRIIF